MRSMGLGTGIDLAALIAVAQWVGGFFDAPLPGQVMKAGAFPEVVQNAASRRRKDNRASPVGSAFAGATG